MMLHIIYAISFTMWCGMFIVLPLYCATDYLSAKLSKAKHYEHGAPKSRVTPTADRDYEFGDFDYLKKIDASYYLSYEECCRRRDELFKLSDMPVKFKRKLTDEEAQEIRTDLQKLLWNGELLRGKEK